jgi:hypothetical protein
MLDRTAKLKTYQTYIDGRWIDAASGKTFETFDPYLDSRGHLFRSATRSMWIRRSTPLRELLRGGRGRR